MLCVRAVNCHCVPGRWRFGCNVVCACCKLSLCTGQVAVWLQLCVPAVNCVTVYRVGACCKLCRCVQGRCVL